MIEGQDDQFGFQHDHLKGKLIIGIDLGTTKSAASVWKADAKRVDVLRGEDGRDLTPSVVAWNREQQNWLVGERARELLQKSPADVVYSIKRYIGRWFNDRSAQRRPDEVTYKLVSGGGRDQLNDILVDYGGVPPAQSAPAISAKVLAKLRGDAAYALNLAPQEIEFAVITVPAYFNALQRAATLEAGKLAGLTVVDILNEPTAAALAYRDQLPMNEGQRILVYDLGGGTFDVSLLEVKVDEVGYVFYTLAVDGDTYLGGDDIDASVVRWIMEEIKVKYGREIAPDDYMARSRLRLEAERAKIKLSTEDATTITLPELMPGGEKPFDVEIELTRDQLEQCAAEVLAKARKIAKRTVEEVAGLTWKDIDKVILVGGQTLMPAVQRSVEQEAGCKPHLIAVPQLAVALGAGEYAYSLSLGRERFHENALINVLALPLGVRLDENTFHHLIEANSHLPTSSAPFRVTTTERDQTSINVRVLQGPRGATQADECVELGSIRMPVLSPAGNERPSFDIEFNVQSDGIMTVTVTNRETGQQKQHDIFDTKTVMRDKSNAEKTGSDTQIN